ncbi:hypothetical protein [Methyloterricola oryzae]|uniref:hypothetical protein n=1 Tax=Methyloterricola oryzae TaxID=1495050 RepID=UPI00069A4236|nr:hypothetical protein [Methyloterricola oryzae]
MTGKGKGLNIVLTFCLGMSAPWVYPADGHLDKPALADVKDSNWLSAFSGWKLPDSVQIHGFASQSYLHTTGNEFFGHSTNMGSLDFTEMGINGSWRPISQLQASLQVVYRRAGRTDDQDLRIDFGFLDYSFISDADNLWGLRFGRVINPYGLYNDTRDMPFTRPSILLPQSIYFDVDRNLSLSSDGIQLYGERRTDFGDFILQFNGGYSRTSDPTFKAVISDPYSGNVEGELSWVGRLMYEWDSGRFRLGVTSAEVNAKYEPKGGGQNYESGRFSFIPIIFSAQYNEEYWSITSEYALRGTEFRGFGPLRPDSDLNGESYYIQGSYKFTDNIEGYMRYDVYYLLQSDRNGKKYAELVNMYAAPEDRIQPYETFAKDFTVGARWDVTDWLMLRAEYHRINGTGWTSTLENSGENNSQHWDMFGVAAAVRF